MVNLNHEPGHSRVLLVEDDATVSDVVVLYLERDGFEVESVADGTLAWERLQQEPYDLIVLDIMLPGIDGIELCRRIRRRLATPIIMLTALGEEDDRIAGLDVGADDYIAKPFSPRELVARIRAVLRRSPGQTLGSVASESVTHGDLVLAGKAREVRLRGDLVALTSLEFELLAFFMRHPREVIERERLLEQVWGYSWGETSTVTVHVRRLREKIEDDPTSPRYVRTVWGVGYRFDP